jgi:NADPH:quinone reductase-like Zn-dependent oxidoreductase
VSGDVAVLAGSGAVGVVVSRVVGDVAYGEVGAVVSELVQLLWVELLADVVVDVSRAICADADMTNATAKSGRKWPPGC